jgi:hypothetical protein
MLLCRARCLLLASVLMSLALARPLRAQTDLVAVTKQALPATAHLHVFQQGAEFATGSGFMVSTGRLRWPTNILATNYHMIDGVDSIYFERQDGSRAVVIGVLAANQLQDWALLQVSGPAVPGLVLGNSDSVRAGERLVHVGNPLNEQFTVLDGLFSRRRDMGNGVSYLLVSIPYTHGSSGGPVLDLSGEVVGIAQGGRDQLGGESLNWAVPSNYVRAGLATVSRPTSLRALARAKQTADSTAVARAFRSYVAPEAIFTASVPRDWETKAEVNVIRGGLVKEIVVVIAPPDAEKAELQGVVSAGIRIAVDIPQPGQQVTLTALEQWAQPALDHYLSGNPGFTLVSEESPILWGRPARAYTVQGKTRGLREAETTVLYYRGVQATRTMIEVTSPESRTSDQRFINTLRGIVAGVRPGEILARP